MVFRTNENPPFRKIGPRRILSRKKHQNLGSPGRIIDCVHMGEILPEQAKKCPRYVTKA